MATCRRVPAGELVIHGHEHEGWRRKRCRRWLRARRPGASSNDGWDASRWRALRRGDPCAAHPIVLTATATGFAAVLSFKAREPVLPTAVASTCTPAPSTPTASSSASKSSSSTTADGDVIPTRYGNAQVRATVSGGKITNVEALQLQGNDPKSVQISSGAAPERADQAERRDRRRQRRRDRDGVDPRASGTGGNAARA
jgi:uncharacterized protein with FMN-binding domain